MSQMATMPTNPIIVIPARLASTRLPGKPLADIHGEPMIVHVWRRGIEAGIGPVVVACAEAEIADAITKAGGQAVLTKPDHPSGSDRIYEALRIVDPDGNHDAVVNVQGDLPTIAPETIRAAYDLLGTEGVDIGTLAVEIIDASERGNPNVVKAVVERAPVNDFAHFCLGKALAQTGRPDEARHHAVLAACMRPDRADYRALRDRLRR